MVESTAWLADFVAAAAAPEAVDSWAERIGAAVLAATPEVASDPDLAVLLAATVREQWQAFLAELTDPTSAPRLVPSAEQVALEVARRHLDLTVLLTAYRAAQGETWAYATEVVALAPPEVDGGALLVELWSRAGRWLDEVTSASIVVHQAERRRVEHSGAAHRYDVVRAVLDGEEPELRELTIALGGYPIEGTHRALVLRALAPGGTRLLEPTASSLCAAVRGRTLTVEPGGRELWLWLPDLPGQLAELLPEKGVLVASGNPATGPDGFRISHQEARQALDLGLAQQQGRTWIPYADVALLTFLARDHAAARRFATSTLGALARDDPGRDKIRETVRQVLLSASVDAAARTFGIHKNTVRYRLGQAETLLGHPISERRTDIAVALDYLAAFPLTPEPEPARD